MRLDGGAPRAGNYYNDVILLGTGSPTASQPRIKIVPVERLDLLAPGSRSPIRKIGALRRLGSSLASTLPVRRCGPREHRNGLSYYLLYLVDIDWTRGR